MELTLKDIKKIIFIFLEVFEEEIRMKNDVNENLYKGQQTISRLSIKMSDKLFLYRAIRST